MMKRWLMLYLLLLMLWPVAAHGQEEPAAPLTGESARIIAQEALDTEFEQMAASETLVLYLQKEREGIAVKDLRSDMVWFSSVQPWQMYGAKAPNKQWGQNIRSLFQLLYAKSENATGDVLQASPGGQEHTLEVLKADNGFGLRYDFPQLELGLDIYFMLDGSTMDVMIPQDQLREGEAFYLMGINLMPFFGATTDVDEGYFLYPNGSGEIYRFKDKKFRQSSMRTYQLPVYAPQIMNYNSFPYGVEDSLWRGNTSNSAMLPLYGIKNGQSAFCVVMTQGDRDADIFISPAGVSVELNRMYTRFTYRKSYGVLGSDVSVGGGFSNSYLAMLIDAEGRPGDRSQRYIFLANEQADYSGMACAARDELMARGVLNASEAELPTLVLDVFCGIIRPEILFNVFVDVTGFDDVQAMVTDLKAAGITPMVNLKGWGNKGAVGYPVLQPAAAKLGGISALKRLAETCREAGVSLTLQANLFKMKKSAGGFELQLDAARDGNNFIYQFESAGEFTTLYLMHPNRARLHAENLLAYALEAGVSGIVFEDYGGSIYDAYGEKSTMRAPMAAIWRDILSKTRDELGVSGAVGGNAYTLDSVDILRDVPEKSTLFLFGDESVPLFQMIVHGSVAYTGQPMNLFYDAQAQRLKNIEYGFTPTFELTQKNTVDLSDTAYNMLFTAQYASWEANLKETYLEQVQVFKQFESARMLRHEQVASKVYQVTYDNGCRVLVNYGDVPYTTAGQQVPPLGYLVTGTEGVYAQ